MFILYHFMRIPLLTFHFIPFATDQLTTLPTTKMGDGE